jgi:hypothetical protein
MALLQAFIKRLVDPESASVVAGIPGSTTAGHDDVCRHRPGPHGDGAITIAVMPQQNHKKPADRRF